MDYARIKCDLSLEEHIKLLGPVEVAVAPGDDFKLEHQTGRVCFSKPVTILFPERVQLSSLVNARRILDIKISEFEAPAEASAD